MRINHNIAALNTYRQLTGNVGNTSNSLEKLSSGLRINKAGDDAAGLAISEKMRAQIRGLEQASRNASDAISLIQTAEGALTETHSMLQRMRELAVQSATDTNTEDDRKEIQKEITNLLAEVDRIAQDTQFNGQELLTGDFKGNFHIGANEGQAMVAAISAMDVKTLGIEILHDPETAEVTEGGGTGTPGVKAAGTGDIAGSEVTVTAAAEGDDYDGIEIVFEAGDDEAVAWGESDGDYTLTITLKKGEAYTEEQIQTLIDGATTGAPEIDDFGLVVALDSDITVPSNDDPLGDAIELSGGAAPVIPDSTVTESPAKGVLTVDDANIAIEKIDEAIQKVSSERAKLGGIQNRLEHTINNLGTTSENLSASESRIRDVDMAKEMMEFTKNNILSQASQAMLAQANMQPQSVLQLLQ